MALDSVHAISSAIYYNYKTDGQTDSPQDSHIYKPSERLRDKQTDKQIDRQTDKKTNRQTYKQSNRQLDKSSCRGSPIIKRFILTGILWVTTVISINMGRAKMTASRMQVPTANFVRKLLLK